MIHQNFATENKDGSLTFFSSQREAVASLTDEQKNNPEEYIMIQTKKGWEPIAGIRKQMKK